MAVVDAEHAGPLRPRVVAGASAGRLRQELEVGDAARAVAHCGSHAVVTCVATADDDDVFAGDLGGDFRERVCASSARCAFCRCACKHRLRVRLQEIHGVLDVRQVAARDAQVARHGGADGVDDGIEIVRKVLGADVGADCAAADELDALGAHEVRAAHNNGFIELHVGDAVHEKAARAVGALVDGDAVAGLVELVGGGETRRSGADHGNGLARAQGGRLRADPALAEGAVDYAGLDGFYADGLVSADIDDASFFTWRRAHAAGELGEIVGHEQAVQGVLPQAAVDHLVEFGDDVGHGAAGVGLAEGDAAVDAAGGLDLELAGGEAGGELFPVVDSGFGGAVLFVSAGVSHEAAKFDEGSGGGGGGGLVDW